VLFTSGDMVRQLAAPAADVVDVTGAGDAFAAAVCFTLAQGGDLSLACARGLRLAALTLGCADTVCPDLSPAAFTEQPA
jgi:pseudouridine kinase